MTYNAISVSELNNYIKDKIEADEMLNNVLIKGEISNFKNHYSGHLYFTLKDEKSLIKCVMFKTYTSHLEFMPKDGMKVMVLGRVGVFERDGVYQVYVTAMKQDGLGDLYEKYEKLKKDLEEKGFFDEAHKKKIPYMPKVIGVLTASTGAVIRDIINVSTRRNPNVNIKLYPVPVQGEGAGEKIADAIRFMNENKICDVLIIGRGGGSIEDLWPFNEEVVAHAIYESEIPIISAVGHETDFTIADFVADLRAPTPSAAAELAVRNVDEVKDNISKYENRLRQALKKKIDVMKLRFEKVMTRRAFTNPLANIDNNKKEIANKSKEIINIIKLKMTNSINEYKKSILRLDTLSPLKTLSRGYGIIEDNNSKKIIKSVKDVSKDEEIKITLSDGSIDAKVL